MKIGVFHLGAIGFNNYSRSGVRLGYIGYWVAMMGTGMADMDPAGLCIGKKRLTNFSVFEFSAFSFFNNIL